MQRRLLLALLCGGAAPPPGGGAAAPSAAVAIDNFQFAPAEIEVPAGTEVTWTNRDDIPHVVMGAGGAALFRSPPLDTGDSFAHRFDHAGRFAYFCSLHAHMQGVVVVR